MTTEVQEIQNSEDRLEENVSETTETSETPSEMINEEEGLTDVSEKNLRAILQNVRDMVGTMESIWSATKSEFNITDSHLKELQVFNKEHMTPPAEDITDEEKENFDWCNGLDHLSEDDVLRIFGENHPVIGITHDLSIARAKEVFQDFLNWWNSQMEYTQIHNSYMELVEDREMQQIKILEDLCEKEEDAEKKAKMQSSLDMYWNRRRLAFLAEAIPDETITRIEKLLHDEKKTAYLINRTREKLKQMRVHPKFILEISQFEKRFLEEKYHENSNILLLYFMTLIVYSKTYDKKDEDRNKAACMVLVLDKFIRNRMDESERITVLENIQKFEDQFLTE